MLCHNQGGNLSGTCRSEGWKVLEHLPFVQSSPIMNKQKGNMITNAETLSERFEHLPSHRSLHDMGTFEHWNGFAKWTVYELKVQWTVSCVLHSYSAAFSSKMEYRMRIVGVACVLYCDLIGCIKTAFSFWNQMNPLTTWLPFQSPLTRVRSQCGLVVPAKMAAPVIPALFAPSWNPALPASPWRPALPVLPTPPWLHPDSLLCPGSLLRPTGGLP